MSQLFLCRISHFVDQIFLDKPLNDVVNPYPCLIHWPSLHLPIYTQAYRYKSLSLSPSLSYPSDAYRGHESQLRSSHLSDPLYSRSLHIDLTINFRSLHLNSLISIKSRVLTSFYLIIEEIRALKSIEQCIRCLHFMIWLCLWRQILILFMVLRVRIVWNILKKAIVVVILLVNTCLLIDFSALIRIYIDIYRVFSVWEVLCEKVAIF